MHSLETFKTIHCNNTGSVHDVSSCLKPEYEVI